MLSVQARAAGYLEGWVTRELLHMHYLNTIVGRCSTVQYSAVQCSAVQCSAVQISTVQYSAVQNSTV